MAIRYGPWLPTRAMAKALGAKHFFTGKPCKNGHALPRLTSNNACVECHNQVTGERNKRKRRENSEWREAANARQRAYYQERPGLNTEQSRRWRLKNPDRNREYNREYQRVRRASDPTHNLMTAERMREKRSSEEYRSAELERERGRYHENPEKFRAKSRAYAKANPEVAAAHARNRRALKLAAEGTHTKEDVLEILMKQGRRCAGCGERLKKTGWHVDHVIALSNGGSNWPSNLQILCAPCNLSKSNLDPLEFARRKGRLL